LRFGKCGVIRRRRLGFGILGLVMKEAVKIIVPPRKFGMIAAERLSSISIARR
jgi:hypothetical protein